MDIIVWNLIFKTGLIAILSFFIPFGIITLFLWIENGSEISKKEWVVISLFSLLAMIIILLIFGINIIK